MSMCYSPPLQRQMRYDPLPLRSSQSIEHKQQIKYWSCLLGSTFFYYRNTISSVSSCYSYRHTNETTRCVKMYPWRSLDRERSLPTYPAEVASLCWLTDWLTGKAEGRNAPPELQEPGPNYSESPSGTHQKSKNKFPDTSFHQVVPALTAETALWPLCGHCSPNCSQRRKI